VFEHIELQRYELRSGRVGEYSNAGAAYSNSGRDPFSIYLDNALCEIGAMLKIAQS